jgi:hypothetical protein
MLPLNPAFQQEPPPLKPARTGFTRSSTTAIACSPLATARPTPVPPRRGLGRSFPGHRPGRRGAGGALVHDSTARRSPAMALGSPTSNCYASSSAVTRSPSWRASSAIRRRMVPNPFWSYGFPRPPPRHHPTTLQSQRKKCVTADSATRCAWLVCSFAWGRGNPG